MQFQAARDAKLISDSVSACALPLVCAAAQLLATVLMTMSCCGPQDWYGVHAQIMSVPGNVCTTGQYVFW